MTLKEKFNDLVPKDFGGMQEPLLTDCEKVADDYAIEFADWVFINGRDLLIRKGLNTGKKLLEEFKKEKEL